MHCGALVVVPAFAFFLTGAAKANAGQSGKALCGDWFAAFAAAGHAVDHFRAPPVHSGTRAHAESPETAKLPQGAGRAGLLRSWLSGIFSRKRRSTRFLRPAGQPTGYVDARA